MFTQGALHDASLRCAPFSSANMQKGALPFIQRHRITHVASAKKGFGGDSTDESQLKINERGKISSRSGPVSPKQLSRVKAEGELKQQQMKAQEQQQRQPQQPTLAGGSSASSQPQRETPQVVVDRMLKRIMAFTGVPVGLGISLLVLFYYLKVVAKVDYPLWMVYLSQFLLLGGSLGGITYGIISSSWEPGREGSFWGWTEAKANLPLLLNRSKQQ